MRELSCVGSSDYDNVSGVITLGGDDMDALYNGVMSAIYEKKIKVSELTAQKATLEDVYFSITGGA
jgi:hypothetical protein